LAINESMSASASSPIVFDFFAKKFFLVFWFLKAISFFFGSVAGSFSAVLFPSIAVVTVIVVVVVAAVVEVPSTLGGSSSPERVLSVVEVLSIVVSPFFD